MSLFNQYMEAAASELKLGQIIKIDGHTFKVKKKIKNGYLVNGQDGQGEKEISDTDAEIYMKDK